MNEAKPHSGHLLTILIFVAIVLAVAAALVAPKFAVATHIGGEVFLRVLKMMVVPLVVTSVMSGILGMGDVRKLGRPGAAAVSYYVITTMLAVMVGLVVVNAFRPGVGSVDEQTLAKYAGTGVDSPKQKMLNALTELTGMSAREVGGVFEDLPNGENETPRISDILKNLVLMLFTDNLFVEASKTNLLPLIVFSIIFAGMLTTMGPRVDTLQRIIEQSNDALMNFVLLLMKLAPLGIFCLVAARFGEAQLDGKFLQEIRQIGWYMVTVLVGLGVHAFITLPAIFWIFRRQNPYAYMLKLAKALLTAFSTASSSATLPITMEATEEAGVDRRATEFVLPLGATINMDGTALYEAAAAIFIGQAIGADMGLVQQATVAITATLAAIGAAGIPEAGLVTMLIVLNAVGLPIEYVGLIIPVDWLLDRFRTATNTWGDSVGAAVIEKTLQKVDAA